MAQLFKKAIGDKIKSTACVYIKRERLSNLSFVVSDMMLCKLDFHVVQNNTPPPLPHAALPSPMGYLDCVNKTILKEFCKTRSVENLI